MSSSASAFRFNFKQHWKLDAGNHGAVHCVAWRGGGLGGNEAGVLLGSVDCCRQLSGRASKWREERDRELLGETSSSRQTFPCVEKYSRSDSTDVCDAIPPTNTLRVRVTNCKQYAWRQAVNGHVKKRRVGWGEAQLLTYRNAARLHLVLRHCNLGIDLQQGLRNERVDWLINISLFECSYQCVHSQIFLVWKSSNTVNKQTQTHILLLFCVTHK